MFWSLILAHLVGDFPLQTDWIARRKRNFFVLSLHGGIHLVLMTLLVGPNRSLVWPYLLLLTLIHMAQDRLKILITDRWSSRSVLLFFIDQLLHISFICVFFVWFQSIDNTVKLMGAPEWVFIATAYVAVTFAWYISERVINHSQKEYLKNLEETKIPRMLARAGFVSLFLLLRAWSLPNIALMALSPYPPSNYRKRAFLTDLGISILVIIFLLITLGMR